MKKTITLVTILFILSITSTYSQAWTDFGGGLGATTETVRTIAVDSTTGGVYVGGTFTGTQNYIAKWNGTAWETLGTGVNGPVYSISIKSPSDIYVGGEFTLAGGTTVSNIARWDGIAWSDVDSGFNDKVKCVYTSSSQIVYAAGEFSQSGSTNLIHIAKLQGNQWVPMGNGVPGVVNAIAEYNSEIHVACEVVNSPIQKFDGSSWVVLSGLSSGKGLALAVYGSYLYAGGEFQLPIRTGARWNGTVWSSMITNFAGGQRINVLYEKYGILYVGGNFTNVGLNNPSYIAKVTNTNSPLQAFTVSSQLTGGEVFAIGNLSGKILAGGTFVTPTGSPTNNLAITTTTINVNEISENVIGKNLFPNPVKQTAILKVVTKTSLKNPTLNVYDLQSRLLENVRMEMNISGNTIEYRIDCSKLASGNYTYTLNENGQAVVSDKFIVE